MFCRRALGPSLLLAFLWTAVAVFSASAETYPDFESQWRNPAPDREPWDPNKPAGLPQQAPLTAHQ